MNPLPHEEKSPLSITLTIVGSLFLVFGLLLIFTNPNQKKYELFAAEQLITYAKENICTATSNNLEQVIKSQVCNLMIDTGKSQIPTVIGKTTQRRNYLLLSIYETNLYLYNFTTIGLLNQFFVIGFEKVYDQ